MQRLVLIDGNAILHRAFHALPPTLTNAKGEMTNAVYGFVAMLLKVIEDLKPGYLAVAFDRPKPTFRKELFKDYQAQRPEMDKGLVPQIEKVHKVLNAMQIPIFEMDGYEADDVIATLASQAFSIRGNLSRHAELVSASKKLEIPKQVRDDNNDIDEIVVVTGDRDLLQLVNDRVKLFMPVKGLTEAKLFGEKEAEERMGIKPAQIPDFKALAGDASDNYPGVAGIGPKTAVELLKEFGTIEKLYKHLGNVKPGVAEKLKNDKDNALLSYKLATVVTDVPLEVDVEKTKLPEDLLTQAVVEVFGELGFKTLLKRLSNMTKGEDDTKDSKKVKKEENKEQMSLF